MSRRSDFAFLRKISAEKEAAVQSRQFDAAADWRGVERVIQRRLGISANTWDSVAAAEFTLRASAQEGET